MVSIYSFILVANENEHQNLTFSSVLDVLNIFQFFIFILFTSNEVHVNTRYVSLQLILILTNESHKANYGHNQPPPWIENRSQHRNFLRILPNLVKLYYGY